MRLFKIISLFNKNTVIIRTIVLLIPSAYMKLLQDLIGGLVLPLLHTDLRLLLQVRGVGRARLPLHLRVLRQLQLLKALKLWDPSAHGNGLHMSRFS